jgi:hypothetical protein
MSLSLLFRTTSSGPVRGAVVLTVSLPNSTVREYPLGSRPLIKATFIDDDGTVYDPPGVTFRYQDPTDAVTTLTYLGSGVGRESTGVYWIDVDTTDKPGVWYFRAFSPTGRGQAASEVLTFVVDPAFA